MAEKKKFLLRLDQGLYEALEAWAAAELRSVNSQMEFLLSESLRRAGRAKKPLSADDETGQEGQP